MNIKVRQVLPHLLLGALVGTVCRFVAFLYFYPGAMAREIGWNRIANLKWDTVLDFNNPTDSQSIVMALLVQHGTLLGGFVMLGFALLSYSITVSQKRMALVLTLIALVCGVLGLQYFLEILFKSALILNQ